MNYNRRKFQSYERVGNAWQYLDKIPDDYAMVYYGDIREDENGEYIELPYMTYSDYSGGTIERSNCDVFLDEFGDLPGVYELYGGFGTRGVLIHQSLLDNEDIKDILDGLDNYPLIDEDNFSKLEMELENEAWEMWIKSDLTFELDKAGIEYNEDEIQDKFYELIRDNSIEFIHEDACCPTINIEKVIECWKEGEE